MRRPSPDATTAVGLALACAAVYALCGGGRFFSVDEVGAFQLTRLWLEGEPIASSHVTWVGPDGRAWNVQGPLLSVAEVPGYPPARVALAGELGRGDRRTGARRYPRRALGWRNAHRRRGAHQLLGDRRDRGA